MRRRRTFPIATVLAPILALATAACAATAPGSTAISSQLGESPGPDLPVEGLTIYSGRSESLIAPLLDQFQLETGIEVQVRYGDTAELASLLLEEGGASPADIFFAQDAGALAAVAQAGMLEPLDDAQLSAVPEGFRDDDGRWVGISGRARVAAYSTERVSAGSLPASILDFTDPAWNGRIGWVPTNGSFQAFVTALRVLETDDVARSWLEGIVANEPMEYDGNTAAVEAVAAGEIDVAFVNHYYLLGLIADQGDAYPVANHHFQSGDPGALVNLAGVGVLASSERHDEASRFVEHLLSVEGQTYFATETYEYPLIDGVAADARLTPLSELGPPALDLSDLADLQGTVQLLRDSGVLD